MKKKPLYNARDKRLPPAAHCSTCASTREKIPSARNVVSLDWETKQVDIADTDKAESKLKAETRGGWELVSVVPLDERRPVMDAITVRVDRYTFKRARS